jgi:hypothetical protein
VAPRVQEFADALRSAVAAARASGATPVDPSLLAMLGALTPDQVSPDMIAGLAAGLGIGGESVLPARMAAVNKLLDVAPPAMRERMLMEFLSLLQRPSF